MHVRELAIAFLGAVFAAAAVNGQDDPADGTTSPPGRGLTPAQIAQRLDDVKAKLLPQIWEPKCDEDESHRRKYLDKWQAVPSAHYLVFTNGPTATCKKYSVTLEKLYAAIQQELPFADLDRPLVAYIFADREDYYRYAVRITGYSEAMARRTAGHANSQFYATYYASPVDPVVFHEATHEIVGACLKVSGVGSWFQEGIAVYFENKMVNDKLDGDTRSDVKRGDWYPLAEFFAIESLLGDPNGHGRRNYMHAGALLNFMINTKLEPVAGKFPEFLAAARKGRGFGRGKDVSEQLIQTVYGLSVAEFEALWVQHLKIR
ncbi:MAG: hypothetical protein WAT39_06315 [Planctomycetota bacterium]